MLLYAAIISITSALIFYTIGVWSEKFQGSLKLWHLIMFWIGLILDTTGTTLMAKISGDVFQFNFHGITGVLAIALMLIHALWATAVLIKNNAAQKLSFHKFSIFVWIIWLIPFVSGMIFGMTQ